jgi:TP901-1 family phage major tail protein
MALNGSSVLLMVPDPNSAGKYIAVAEQTGLSVEESKNLIEISAKGDTHQKSMYGRQEGTISLEGMYVPNDTAYKELKKAFDNKTTILVRRDGGSGDIEQATCLIESISREFPDDDVSTVSVELRLNEAFTVV